ncbi:MAG: radical SAM protein [Candidatus Omnitrophica bacterium]|nr:radical SAM protein [Candidatus Omnitrophota bacterium]
MKKADIKTGFLCNNNCQFCVQGDKKKKLGNKTTDEIKKILKNASRDCQIVVFTGGEVTTRKDLIELITYARKLKFKTIQIQSNGRMFAYEKFCEEIIDAGANEFALAIHGHIPEVHNWLTQSKSFHHTVTGMKNLRKLGQRILTNTVITKSNYRHLSEIAKLLISLDVEQFQFAFVHALGAAEKNFDRIVPRVSLVAPHLKKALDIGRHFRKRAMVEAVPYCFLKGYEDCISENIMPDGKIYEFNYVIPDFTSSRINDGKTRGPNCQKCKFLNVCEGPWKEYPQRFGWEEFKPIRNT